MVRTRENNTQRKAVAAKAPRKVLGSNSGGSSMAGMSSPSGKAAKYAGGNIACARPVPDWQKGIGAFLSKTPNEKEDEEKEDEENAAPAEVDAADAGGSSSSQGSSASSAPAPDSPPAAKNGIISDDDED